MKITYFFNKSFVVVGWFVILAAFVVLATGHRISKANEITAEDEVVNTVVAVAQPLSQRKMISSTELTCMAKNIYYEAGSESFLGKLAVGHVVLNRLSKSAYPNTVCGVVNERSKDSLVCQFSWVCNPSIPSINTSSQNWRHSYDVALQLLSSVHLKDITEGATHFHALSVRPSWAQNKKKVVTIDGHVFYK